MGLQIQILNASTSGEIDAAFATIVRERLDALYVGNESFFNSRRVQLVHRATLHKVPASYSQRQYPEDRRADELWNQLGCALTWARRYAPLPTLRATSSASDRCVPARENCAPAPRRHSSSPPRRSTGRAREALDEFRHARRQAEHVFEHQNLAVAGGAGADADGGDRDLRGDAAAERLGDGFEHQRERAGVGDRAGVGSRSAPSRVSSRPCARNEPMVLIDCGVRPTWPITGTPRSVRKRMVSAMRRPPSTLMAPQPVSFMHARGGGEGLLLGGLVGAERHVDDDQRALRSRASPRGPAGSSCRA